MGESLASPPKLRKSKTTNLRTNNGERSEASKREYFAKYAAEIQRQVSFALDDALLQDYGDENPLMVMGRTLLESQDVDTSVLDFHPLRKIDPLRIGPHDLALQGCFKQAAETARNPRPDSPAPSTASSNGPEWSLTGWLTSLELDSIVADALRYPLHEELKDSSDRETIREAEHSFINTLGDLSSYEPVLRLLQKEDLLERLAETLWRGAKQHSETDGEGGHGTGKSGAASKFFEDGDEAMKFGELSTFYEGLDHFLGPPNPNLAEAMENEHCKANDSKLEFRVSNYNTLTTPEREYFFVKDPSEAQLKQLGLKYWPHEERLFGGKAEYEIAMAETDSDQQKPTDVRLRDKARKAFPPSHFESELNEKNDQLRGRGAEALQEVELIGGRLYTGPMYSKYNAVLRDIGHVQGEQITKLSEGALAEALIEYHENKPIREPTAAITAEDKAAARMAECTAGNLYTTSLHVINSCILKLGKLARAGPVYRGISRKCLPKNLMFKDNVSNVRGGVEFGFTSCSVEKKVALEYAQAADDPRTPILLEMQQGMIDRGADLTWLSQYPFEREVMLPPLTGLEFLHHRVENVDGDILIVAVRPSVNLRSMTIEKVIAKMQASHVQLLDLLTDGLRFAGVSPDALQPLTSLKARARQRDPLWFNATDNYRNATNGALDEQTRCFKLVLDDLKSDLKSAKARRPLEGKALVPESLEAERRRIKSTAFVAARAGQHEIAVELLLGRRRLEEGNKDETTPESLEAIAKELLDDGCKRPWPATLVALAGKRTHGLKDACLAQGCVEKLVRQALAGATVKPFSVGSEVLVCKELSFSASSSTWTNALIAKAAGPPASADESSRQKLSDDELTALVVEQHGSEPEDVAKFSGYVYNVEINGQVEQLPEEQVVQVDPHGGVAEVLKVAAATGDPDLVKELLDAGVNVFVTDTHLNTALIRVAEAVDIDTEHGSGQELCIKMLADRHPKQFFELRNKLRQNSFDIAVKNRSYVALRTMQPERHPGDTDIHKADVVSFRKRGNWAHDEKGWQNDVTTLMLTCRYHSHEPRVSAVKALLEAGANVDAVTAQKVTALHMAVDDMRVDIVEVLLASKANPNHEDEVARTPLLQAAQSGCVKVVDALIRFGADVLYQRKASRSILTYAAQYGYVDVAKRLLDAPDAAGRGDRPPLLNMRNKKGEESALTFAARYGHVPMCHLLLKRGIDLKHELEKPYWTSLHRACANGHTETASLLLRAEPGLLNHTKDTGITALMAAATAGYTETVILLLGQKGLGSLGAKDSKGKHALWLAAANGNEETVSVLAKHEPSCVDLIVEASAGAFRRDSDGGGPGQVAADDLTQTGGGQSSGRERIKGLDTTTTNIMQPTTALMAAAYFGHAGVVRVLHAEKANLAMFSEPPAEWTPGKQRPDDALLLATRNGHQPVVRILASLQQARRRLMEAQRLAESLKRQAITEGKTARVEQFKAILEVIMRPSMRRQRTNSVFRNHAGMKKQRSKGGMSEEEWLELGGRIRSNVKKLKWDRTAAFDGQIVPPRPHEDELKEEATPLGPLAKDDGVVVQAGPFGSIWLRAGCIRRVPWHTLWRTLKAYIEVVLQDETQKVKPGAVYVVVSLRSMQSIDFTWLAEQGFRFHHHRAPGHGATPHGVSSGNGDGSNGSGVAVADQGAVGGNAPTPTPPTPDVSDTEYVYYAWPGASMDMVPVYATSVEGATALVFSPDETKLLLVWERQAWSTPGGAVNAGESKLDALAREVQEEVGVVIDREWDGIRFLGGYQQEKARDGLVNDNFACFSVRATSDHFAVDGKEIHTAHWIPWKPVLKKWIANGRPKEKKVPFEDFGSLVGNPSIPSEKNVVLYNLLQWLETWVDDRGYRVKLKSSQQGSLPITKALFNSSF